MSVIKIGDNFIGDNFPVYIIAEIGQNHQGDLQCAKDMIKEAKRIGVNCVKFQKSVLTEKFTKSALERPYKSIHAWGDTYGEHKEFLEFSIEQYKELQEYSKSLQIDFTASAMDQISFAQLCELKVPFIKIGSGDANNFRMIKQAADDTQEIPVIISTGMQKLSTIKKIIEIMESRKFVLLHCISSYPTEPRDVNLKMIDYYKKMSSNLIVGYSGHEKGILISQAAVLLGAKVIERHFTFNKSQKGSDHKLSLEPKEFEHLIKNIRKIELNAKLNSIERIDNLIENLKLFNDLTEQDELDLNLALTENIKPKSILNCEIDCYKKLGKTLVYANDLEAGRVLSKMDLKFKVSEPKGLPAEQYFDIIGQFLLINVKLDDPVFKNHLSF